MSSDSDSGPEKTPPPKKKSKKESGSKKEESSSKASSSNGKKSSSKNDEGNEMFEIGNKRFVTPREFKGKVYIDIREFYEKDGKTLPGKKGISLTVQQWESLKEQLSEIDAVIKEF